MTERSGHDAGDADAARGPLHGIRVLDFTSVVAGPYCTRLLSDLGAEVIKIESADGDSNRDREPLRGGRSAQYGYHNAGKKSVVLDLKSAAGREAAYDLAKISDVAVENWRPGVAGRLKVDYAALSAIRPDIVYCSISGFGQTGPQAQRAAYASIIEASSGMAAAQQAVEQSERPQVCGLFMSDAISAVWAFGAIQAGLVQRERTGLGQYIDVAMLDSILGLLFQDIMQAQFGEFVRRFHLPLATRDGHIVVPPVTEANFRALIRAVGHPEWGDDPRFATSIARNAGWFDLLRTIETWTREHSTAECERILHAAGVPCSRFRTPAEALVDEQMRHRGTLASVQDGSGSIDVMQVPFLMPGTNTRVRPRVADLGEDTAEVLQGLLGYSAEQVRVCSGQDNAISKAS